MKKLQISPEVSDFFFKNPGWVSRGRYTSKNGCIGNSMVVSNIFVVFAHIWGDDPI